jgi:hypothetical protein
MDKLKPFAIPLVALVLLLIWYFFVSPRLSEQAAGEADKGGAKAEPSQ